MRELHQVQDDSPERSILARLILSNQTVEADPLEELHGLATTAGTEVMDELVQRRPSPDHSTYLGKGKVEELRLMVERHDADLVIFDNDLSPAQTRNLEKSVGAKVLDRTELILDIFAAGARTYESRLAIELAQLEYSLPRLKRMWTHLSRQAMGVGMRGPGEKQLEVDRRLAQKRIHDLKQELSKVEQRRERQVKARKEAPTVSLVGYTNAGKSTLMNALTEADVLAEDKLFATLDTRTRRWQLPGWGTVLLSDTVGFIRDLPHSLVASFKSTLEETRQAELLLHVADASSPTVFNQISAVYSVLTDLGIEEKDTLLILNKIDAIRDPATLNRVLDRYPNAITVSARSSKGLTLLTEAVGEALGREFLDLEIDVDATNGRLLAFLAAKGEVVSQTCNETTITVRVRMPTGAMGQVHKSALAIRPADGDPMCCDVVTSDVVTPDVTTDSADAHHLGSTSPDENDADPPMSNADTEPTRASTTHSDNQASEPSDVAPITDNPISDTSTEVA
ncbi:MAG: GTPase HflX [Rubripirellula sp.]